jgi:hypothetical protein
MMIQLPLGSNKLSQLPKQNGGLVNPLQFICTDFHKLMGLQSLCSVKDDKLELLERSTFSTIDLFLQFVHFFVKTLTFLR